MTSRIYQHSGFGLRPQTLYGTGNSFSVPVPYFKRPCLCNLSRELATHGRHRGNTAGISWVVV